MIAIISKNSVLAAVNTEAWRVTKKRIIEDEVKSVAKSGTINYSDIINDIDYITWKTAKVRISEEEQQFDVQTDSTNKKWIDRRYKAAVEHIKDLLHSHITNTNNVSGVDYTLQFQFPDTWTGSISSIMAYIHNYIVDYTLYEWFRMTMPNEAAPYLTSSEDWKQKMLAEVASELDNVGWFDNQFATHSEEVASLLRWCASISSEGDLCKYTFNFSSAWRGNINALANQMHHYITDHILAEWFKNTMPNEAAAYLTSAAEWERKMIHEARSEDVSNVFFRL